MKSILKKIFFLPGWAVFTISLPSFALVAYVLAMGIQNWQAYVGYAASAYSLVLVCCTLAKAVSSCKSRWRNSFVMRHAKRSPVLSQLISNRSYRALAGLYAGFFLNTAYAAFNMISGVVFHSPWFGAIAWYYLVLALMRFLLVHYVYSHSAEGRKLEQWRRCRTCGFILILMSQALEAIVALVVYRNSGFVYPGFFIYLMAAYAFWSVINAVRNVVIFRNLESPVLWAAKMLGLVAAMVTMLSMETAMLTQFGSGNSGTFRRIMTSCTGGAVCIITFSMAIYMIVVSLRQIKHLKKQDPLS